MTKNQQTKVAREFVTNGQEINLKDGHQVGIGGQQMLLEGLQKGHELPSSGFQSRHYGHEITPSSFPKRDFAPAKGPKIPPVKK